MENNDLNLIIKKEVICDALASLIGVVEKRNSIQQLSHVKIEAVRDDEVSFSATDLDIFIVKVVKAEVNGVGGFTLSITTLYDIVKKFAVGASIRLEKCNSNIEITFSNVFFALPYLEISEFPFVNEGDYQISFALSQENFVQLFSKTKFAISTEESRYSLTGLYFHAFNNELRSTTTDGHRLALTRMKFTVEDFAVLISRKTVIELIKLFEKFKDTNQSYGYDMIQVHISKNKVKLSCDNTDTSHTYIISKLIAAEFPRYQSLLPEKYEKVISIKKQDLIAAVDRVSAIYTDKSRSVSLHFFEDKRLKITSNNSDSSNAYEFIETDYDGRIFDISFNYSYMLEMLHHVDGDLVKMSFNDDSSASMIENGNTIYIIMPMRVTDC